MVMVLIHCSLDPFVNLNLVSGLNAGSSRTIIRLFRKSIDMKLTIAGSDYWKLELILLPQMRHGVMP